jgi:hypothetical protein
MVHYNQVGLVLGMQKWFNIRKSINAIPYGNRLKEENHLCVSVDAKKAFD